MRNSVSYVCKRLKVIGVPKSKRKAVADFIRRHKDNVICVKDAQGEVKGVAVFYRMSDKSLYDLTPWHVMNKELITRLMNETGRNIHIIHLAADDIQTIIRGFQELKRREQPKTISWFTPDMKHLKVRKICLYRN